MSSEKGETLFSTLTTGKNDHAFHTAITQASKGDYKAAQATWAENLGRNNLWGTVDEV